MASWGAPCTSWTSAGQTGASVVAVLREGTVLLNPEPTVTFIAGDLLGVLGQTAQCRAFQQLAQQPAEESPDVT